MVVIKSFTIAAALVASVALARPLAPTAAEMARANSTLYDRLKLDSETAAKAAASAGDGGAVDNSTNISADTLQLYVGFAMSAYSTSVHDQKTWSCTGCCSGATAGTEVVATFGTDGEYEAYGSVLVNHEHRVIVTTFRGTSSLNDWLADARLLLDTLDLPLGNYNPARSMATLNGATMQPKLQLPEGISVHKGFQEYYLTARQVVQSNVHDLVAQYPSYSIAFVGHSMGAGIASLAAVDYLDLSGADQASKVSIYTYGMPRSGNLVWANWVASLNFNTLARVTRQKDMVPHLPPYGSGYVHVMEEHGIDIDGVLGPCKRSGEGGESVNCQNLNFWWPTKEAHISGYFNVRPCTD